MALLVTLKERRKQSVKRLQFLMQTLHLSRGNVQLRLAPGGWRCGRRYAFWQFLAFSRPVISDRNLPRSEREVTL